MAAGKRIVLPRDTDKKYLGLFTANKMFYRTFFPLLLVVCLQQLAALTVNLVDNLMLGTYTELALSGATLVNQIQFTLQQLAAGIGMGIVVLGAQYWGQQRTEPIRKIIGIGFKCGMLAGLIFFALCMCLPHGVLSLFTDDEEVIAEGMRYLRIICWTYPIFALSNSLMYSLQSVETAFIGTVMSLCTIVINLCLNYCFIFGHFGAPEMGVAGAALATLMSRIIELVIILVYVFFIDRKLRMKPLDLLRFDTTYLKDYLHVSTPIIITGMLWGVAQAAQTAVLGHIGAVAIAANSIAVMLFQYFVVLGNSCANAASVTIGKTIGEGRLDMVRSYSKTMQAVFLLIGLVCGGLLFVCKDAIVGIYAVSEETRQLALNFCTVQAVCAVGSCYEYPVMSGIIAGGGDTRYAAIVDNVFIWLFAIPTACLSAFVLHLPPICTFICLKADQVLKCLPNAIACNRFRWVRMLTKEAPES